MGFMKILPWLILIGIALFFLKRKQNEKNMKKMRDEIESLRQTLRKEHSPVSSSSQEMEKCPYCGAYFPHNEGVIKNGRLYCSADCARRDTP